MYKSVSKQIYIDLFIKLYQDKSLKHQTYLTDTENLQHTIDVVYGARRGIIDRLHSAVIGTHSVSREHLNGQGIVLFYIHIYKKPKEIIQVTTSKPSNSPNLKLPVE